MSSASARFLFSAILYLCPFLLIVALGVDWIRSRTKFLVVYMLDLHSTSLLLIFAQSRNVELETGITQWRIVPVKFLIIVIVID